MEKLRKFSAHDIESDGGSEAKMIFRHPVMQYNMKGTLHECD
jgi:hypothetical protein